MANVRKALRQHREPWQKLIEWLLIAFAMFGSSPLNAIYPYFTPTPKKPAPAMERVSYDQEPSLEEGVFSLTPTSGYR